MEVVFDAIVRSLYRVAPVEKVVVVDNPAAEIRLHDSNKITQMKNIFDVKDLHE